MTQLAFPIEHLLTIRDYVRYGTSRFETADLVYGHGTTSAFEEAVFLVLEVLHLQPDSLATDAEAFWDARLTLTERLAVCETIEARISTRKPAPYLVNKAYIQGMPFYVDERVIVPRSYIGELLFSGLFEGEEFSVRSEAESVERVLDLCTGSGCLAILAAQVFPNAHIDAVDLSPDALEVARRNVEDYGLSDRITLYEGSLFEPVKGQTYDIILTNPPYVPAQSMAELPEEYRNEPEMALAGGEDGLDLVYQILKDAPQHLTKNGGLLCEIGHERETLEAMRPALPFLWVETEDSWDNVFWLEKEQL